MQELLVIELPYPPSVNHYWRQWRGKVLISRAGQAFRHRVCSLVYAAKVEPMAGPLCVAIDLFPPDARRRDCDNAMKALLDALQHAGAYGDDSQITWLLTQKAQVHPGGKAVVRVWQRGSCHSQLQQIEDVTKWTCLPLNLN